jgi:hypothetical protein
VLILGNSCWRLTFSCTVYYVLSTKKYAVVGHESWANAAVGLWPLVF